MPGLPLSAFQVSGIAAECCGSGLGIEGIDLSPDFNRISVKAVSGYDANSETTEYCYDAAKHVYLECPPVR